MVFNINSRMHHQLFAYNYASKFYSATILSNSIFCFPNRSRSHCFTRISSMHFVKGKRFQNISWSPLLGFAWAWTWMRLGCPFDPKQQHPHTYSRFRALTWRRRRWALDEGWWQRPWLDLGLSCCCSCWASLAAFSISKLASKVSSSPSSLMESAIGDLEREANLEAEEDKWLKLLQSRK